MNLSKWRRRAGGLVIESIFNSTARLARLHPQASPARHGVEVLRDIPYAGWGEREHLSDIYRPIARPNHASGLYPVVLYVHGGAFQILSKETHWIMALMFARAGYLVVNINYRLAPRHPYPAALEDCAAAYEWVVKNVRSFGGDATRLVLAGESAGANLVTAMSVAASYERPEPFAKRIFATGVVPRATIPACGVLQVSDSARFHRRKPLSAWLRDRLEEVEAGYLAGGPSPHGLDMADPLLILERQEKPQRPLPGFFLPCGTRDPLLDDTRRMHKALDGLGVANEMQVYPNEPHAFHALAWRPSSRDLWDRSLRFAEKALENHPAPEVAHQA